MLILASASPRRRDLLEQIGLTFTVETADIDETPQLGEDPVAYVKRLAEHKAGAVFAHHSERDRLIVLGADTTVVVDGQILGKRRMKPMPRACCGCSPGAPTRSSPAWRW